MRGTSRARRWSDERGYLMVALIVAMSVMGIMMGAALPAWHTMMRREKEAELVFRGEQYARAIGLYQRKFPNAPVPSIDELVEQRLLRKKYKDPITNDEFVEVKPGTALPGEQSSPTSSSGGRQGQAASAMRTAADALRQTRATQGRTGGASAGIVGVTSKSTEKSLRLYNGRGAYNEWIFMPVQQSARAGGPAGARGAGDGRGGPGRGTTPQTPGRGATPTTNPGRGGFESRPVLPSRGIGPGAAPGGAGRSGAGQANPPQGVRP